MDFDTEEIYYDKLNREIRISKPNNPSLIKGGKEGSIYEVISYKNIKYNANNLIFKCFDRSIDPYEKYEKVTDMIRRNESSSYAKYFNSISDCVAFPLEAVYRGENRRDFVGFLMRKMSGNCNFKEYTRNANHTYYNFTNCVNIANSLCKIVYNIHLMGYVIGDFNDLNILVDSKNGNVYLVDADSFIFNKYTIEIGRPEMLPKEIVETQRRVKETKEALNITYNNSTDDYALAVHIYKLFTGCYPYIHKNRTEDPKDDSSIAYAVLNQRFPLISPVCSQPTHFFPLKTIPKDLSNLLAKSFSEKKRPNAAAYMAALSKVKYKYKKCSRDDKHVYYKELGKCPCCEYAKANGLYVKEDNTRNNTKINNKKNKNYKLKRRFNLVALLVVLLKIILFILPFVAIGLSAYYVGPIKFLNMIYLFKDRVWYFYLLEAAVLLILILLGVYAVSHTGEFSSKKEKVISFIFGIFTYICVAMICLIGFKRPIIENIEFRDYDDRIDVSASKVDLVLKLDSSISNVKYLLEDLEVIPSSDELVCSVNEDLIVSIEMNEKGHYSLIFKSKSQNKITKTLNIIYQ